jgi:uncharacterized protein (TIGR03435 family)
LRLLRIGFVLQMIGFPCLIGFVLLTAVTPRLMSQPATTAPVEFEVASIKLQPWNGDGNVGVFVKGDTLYAEHVGLNELVEYAWNLRGGNLSGGPGWAIRGKLVESTLFQVTAKATGNPPPSTDQFRLMLQTLLVERFHLRVRHTTKILPIYNLVVSKGGVKMKESPADAVFAAQISGGSPGRMTRMVSKGVTAQWLVNNQLSGASHRPVFDKTGLTARYDFTLEWVAENPAATPDAPMAEGPSLFTALQEQLGLRLESATAPFDTIEIEHAEKPTEN